MTAYPPALRSTLGRTAGRYPSGGFLEDLARIATAGAMGAAGLVRCARAHDSHSRGSFDSTALAWFAYAASSRVGSDLAVSDIADLFDLAYRVGGYRVLNPQMNTVWVGALLASGRLEEFRFALERTGTQPEVLWAADTDSLHPDSSPDRATAWLDSFNSTFVAAELEGISVGPGDGDPIHRLVVDAAPIGVSAGPLVSVIVPVFNPDRSLRTAVTSLTAQTWTNLEILLCDDASTEGEQLLHDLAASDPRIRVIRGDRNRGAYAARNMGLARALGDYVTFNDADDWSHPRRIERQLREVSGEDPARACISWGIRAAADLRLSVLGQTPQWANLSSMLFPRADLGRLGGFDAVRKGADSEFVARYRTLFGEEALREIATPLAIIQLTAGSLSRDDLRFLRVHPARRQYINAFKHWHLGLDQDPRGGFVPAGARAPFPAPAFIRGGTDPRPDLDVLILANLDAEAPTVVDLAEEVRALADAGLRVGVQEFLGPFDMTQRVRLAAAGTAVADVLHSGRAVRVLPEEPARTRLVLIHDPAAVESMPAEVLDPIDAGAVVIAADYDPLDRTRYDPQRIESVIADHLGRKPTWVPATARIAEALTCCGASEVAQPALAACIGPPLRRSGDDGKGAVHAEASPLRVGIHLGQAQLMGEAAVAALLGRLVPRSIGTDVIVWGPRRHTAPHEVPDVLRLDPGEATVAEFADRVEVMIVPEALGRGPHLDRAATTALQRGCIVVLEENDREHFGEAALYLDGRPATELIDMLAASPRTRAEQRERGRTFCDSELSPRTFAGRFPALLNHERTAG
ncbi:glycosyltransferase [Pseudactinotalea sp. HY160]|uniref:glycosyltransferase family 2 protein n=1 Tax=Pseudactinotalea sp. HY160 TaxID=2654490 RepID=UPI00128DC2A9|nr:glycosyltransferase family 2 protein [Pseudactinotalea sp. HY160]MPV50710.1 glycosyltransferase [Pseudactinotalea sp. HY160]